MRSRLQKVVGCAAQRQTSRDAQDEHKSIVLWPAHHTKKIHLRLARSVFPIPTCLHEPFFLPFLPNASGRGAAAAQRIKRAQEAQGGGDPRALGRQHRHGHRGPTGGSPEANKHPENSPTDRPHLQHRSAGARQGRRGRGGDADALAAAVAAGEPSSAAAAASRRRRGRGCAAPAAAANDAPAAPAVTEGWRKKPSGFLPAGGVIWDRVVAGTLVERPRD